MVNKSLHIDFEEINHINDLNPENRDLLQQAIAAATDAYAPYSEFYVGAAILLENGDVITGNNQENAAYPSGLCAERVALFYAGAKYPGVRIKAIAIAAFKDEKLTSVPVSPCGGCRQVLHETEMRNKERIRIILGGSGTIRLIGSAADLLPLPFSSFRSPPKP